MILGNQPAGPSSQGACFVVQKSQNERNIDRNGVKPEGNPESEATRLEQVWAGDFGRDYTERNRKAESRRGLFWNRILSRYPATRVLEIGCNSGANLKWICQTVPPCQVYGVDICEHALVQLRRSIPTVNALWAQARFLPFRDNWFDLVFTAGVLIHQPEVALPRVMSEIARCARAYVLCMEYFSETVEEIPYRGLGGALFKRNYGRIYKELFPALELLEKGELTREEGWDRLTYWLFRKNDVPLEG